jgi:hypothetical protein
LDGDDGPPGGPLPESDDGEAAGGAAPATAGGRACGIFNGLALVGLPLVLLGWMSARRRQP